MVDRGNKKNRPELLAPAGNFEGFLACIKAGCDAVYLGGSKFGARAYAVNFTDDEIIYAIKYAHICGVRVYLTVNTLVKEREFEEVTEYVRPFVQAGLDAFIVQDIGLMKILIDIFPQTEVHVSTQAFVTGSFSARYFKDMGASRVVLARELTLDEIKEIKEEADIEVEAFIHGSMCYSFSGQCLFSSALGGRSGNRGRCAGPCRHSYIPSFDGNRFDESYILSMKDQCTLSILPMLIEAGIDSFKIEGRMKKPEYTAFVTYIYRKYIDAYLSGKEFKVSSKDLDACKRIYIRTAVQTGYYSTLNGPEMITLDNPAYAGSNDELLEDIRRRFIDNPPKKAVSVYFSCRTGENMSLSLVSDDKNVTVKSDVAEKAINRETTFQDVKKQLAKFGNTPFIGDNIEIILDPGLFIPVKTLNELRRKATEELINAY